MKTKTLLKLSILPTLLYLASPVIMASTANTALHHTPTPLEIQIPGNVELMPPNELAKSISYHRRAKLERLHVSIKMHTKHFVTGLS